MGVELDSRMQYDFPGIGFTPSVGCEVYNPSGHTIDTYVSQSGDTWTISSRPVSTKDIYFNLRTGRAYTWNGTKMVNAHLTPDVTSGIPACDHVFSQDNTTYYVTEPIINETIDIGSGCTIEFYGNGCLVGCTLNGRGTKIVPHGTQQIFKGCTFNSQAQGDTFVDSQLYATNFGAISDMHTVEMDGVWSFKGLTVSNLKVHRGYTEQETCYSQFSGKVNDDAWTLMAAFLKNSNGISINFNGKFMGANVRDIEIRNSRYLDFYGGTMLRGFAIIDCQNVDIHDMCFVGVHEVHDFPTVLNDKAEFLENLLQQHDDEAYYENLNYTYNCAYVGDVDENRETDIEEMGALVSCGLSGDGVKVLRESADFADCHVSVHDCHFEMRQGGVAFNSRYKSLPLNEVKILSYGEVRDCTFSHIYFQPVGSHAEHVTIENIHSTYCLQGLDISTCASNTLVRNCEFRKCSSGPKQESYVPYTPLTHDNVVENCLFEMTDDYYIKNTLRYLLTVNKGLANDTFVMRNCEFTVSSAYKFGGMYFRSWRTTLDNVKLKVTINRVPENALDYDILYLMGMGGATPHSPIVEMSHVDIECNARIEALAFRGVSLNDAGPMQLNMNYVHVHGLGQATIMFEKMDYVVLNKCLFELTATTFIRYTHEVTVRNSEVRQISGYGVIAYTISDANYLIEDSVFDVGARFLWIQATGGSIIIRRNTIKCAPLVWCKWDGTAYVEFANNDITDSSSSGTLLFNHVIQQPDYNYWTDGGQSELIFTNNVVHYPGSGTKCVVYSGQYPDYAHLFYSNFLCRGVKPFNSGTSGERPTTPWQGMLHLESGAYHFYDENNGWS